MQHPAPFDPIEDSPLLALRRTLWQLAVVGVVAAIATQRVAPDTHAVALWCVLVPLSALAAHFRRELWDLCRVQRHADLPYPRARRSGKPQTNVRRVPAMAVRRNAGLRMRGVR